jgi:hypothetical protein
MEPGICCQANADRRRWTFSMVLAFCLSPIALLPAQSTPSSQAPPQGQAKPAEAPKLDEPLVVPGTFASISGTVLSASTGDPVVGAEVQAMERNGKDFQIAKSDAKGMYRISGLLSGSYLLTSSQSGFITAEFGRESRRAVPFYLAVAAAQQISNIDFRLQKSSSISGVITGEDGRPVPGVSVQALSSFYTATGPHLEPRASGRSDGQGRYRIAALGPGDYYIQAMKIAGPQGYSGVFYPNTTDAAASRPLPLVIGQDMTGINLSLKRSPGHRVAGKLIDARTDTQVKESFTVSIVPDLGTSGVLATIAADGSFQFASLISGKYHLTASMSDVKGGLVFKASKDIEVGQTDLTNLVVKIGMGVTVRVAVSPKEGTLMSRRLPLVLVRRDEEDDPVRSLQPWGYAIEGANYYEFRNVPAGQYRLALGATSNSLMRHFFVEDVTESSAANPSDASPAKSVQEEGFAVPEAPATVQLSAVVNLHGGMFTGLATDTEKHPLLGRAIVLIAADRALRSQRRYCQVSWTDSAGGFQFSGVVPGDYLVILWTGSDPGEAQNPKFFDELDHNGARVNIPPDGQVSLALKGGSSFPRP